MTTKSIEKSAKYFEGIGRRKTSVARVRLVKIASSKDKNGSKKQIDHTFFMVNNKLFTEYFPKGEFQSLVIEPLEKLKLLGKFQISVKVAGGGIKGQSEAVRLGIARALIKYEPEFRSELKSYGFLTRDPRMKERKKYGLKKARRAAQWSKR